MKHFKYAKVFVSVVLENMLYNTSFFGQESNVIEKNKNEIKLDVFDLIFC